MVAPVGLVVSAVDRVALERLAVSTVEPHGRVLQARAMLALADGESVCATAYMLDTYPNTVTRWREKFLEGGVDALGTVAAGRGRKPQITQATIDAIVWDTLHTSPDDGSTEWSTRTLGAVHGVGKDMVAQIWQERNLKPWRRDTFKVSTDPRFEEKIVDVVGLYLDPPEGAIVFSFDEKTQCQALDRTQPSLPMKPGRNKTMTHDYKRHGTIDLFAAMNVHTGEVFHRTRNRHAGADVLAFFKQIELHTPKGLQIHVVLDNLSAHTAPAVREWLAGPKRKHWHMHPTPTSASWLNLVEGWFAQLTNKRLKNGSFNSIAELKDAIDTWTDHWKVDPTPFVWTKPAEKLIATHRRAKATLNHVTKSATDH